MTEMNAELLARLVVGRKRDGRCTYDPLAKQTLIDECLKPGVSVARVAMRYGLNANLLRTWIAKSGQPNHGQARAVPGKVLAPAAAFVAVQVTAPAAPAPVALCLHVRLPNGVALEVGQVPLEAMAPVLQLLGTLACSR
ncbi:MAG: transposase family protein [Polaromonas sp.]|nr:transposase family protein [Polaromonas sp.]